MIKLFIRFNHDTIPIEIEKESKISHLMEKISSELSIPPEKQQIIFKGNKIENNPENDLSSFKISDRSKLLLIQKEAEAEANSGITKNMQTRIGRSSYTINMQPEFLNADPHAPIIAKGVPPNCEKPFQTIIKILPKNPFQVYNTDGVLSYLTFETDAVWVTSENDKNERIFFSDIKNSLIQEIPGYEKQYVALCLLTKYGKRWFYFIPTQYSYLIKQILP